MIYRNTGAFAAAAGVPLFRFDGDFEFSIRAGLEQITGKRADANETAFFARELEYVYTQTYDIKYPNLKARQLFPVETRVPTGADSFTYSQFDKKVEAEIVHNYAQDFQNAEVMGKQFKQGVVSVGDSYQYSIQDLRAAAMAGRPLETMKAEAARWGIDYKLESLAAIGDVNTGLTGIFNTPSLVATTKVSQNNAGSTTVTWAALISDALAKGNLTAAVQEILKDVSAMSRQISVQSDGLFMGDTLVLPVASYFLLANTQRAPGFTDDTILQYILKTVPGLRSIEFWPQANAVASSVLSGAGGNGVALMYQKTPDVVQLVIPQEFEQFAPQPRNMSWIIPCHMRTGAITVRYPVALTYMLGTINANGT
jgi:hypothetical protein